MAIVTAWKNRTAYRRSHPEVRMGSNLRNYKNMNNKKLKDGLGVAGKKHTVIQP